MTDLLNKIVKSVLFLMVILGLGLIFKSKLEHQALVSIDPISAKSLILKKYLLQYQRPARIEIAGLSTKFENEIVAIKKLKIAQNSSSDFYVLVKLFTDETDTNAPLVAQIQFIDLKSGNLGKEESINLE